MFSKIGRFFLCAMLAGPGALRLISQQNTQPANPAPQPQKENSRLEHGREFLGLGPGADPVAAARGKLLFTQNCSFCHGANATGAEGPDLVRSTVVLHDEKGELVGAVILKGRPEKGMPAFPGMSPAQIYDIAEFLHARVDEAANRWGYKVQNVVTGNAAAGKLFFDSHCTNCHSATGTGDLAHIAGKFEPADLQAQFLYPSESAAAAAGANKDAYQISVTVIPTSGDTISGKLKRIDDFNISLWDSSGMFHSWPRSEVKVEIHDPLAGHLELLDQYTNADMHNILAYLVTLK